MSKKIFFSTLNIAINFYILQTHYSGYLGRNTVWKSILKIGERFLPEYEEFKSFDIKFSH